MIFADKLITLRKKAGWSQEELAEKLNVTRQSVSKWEGAQSVPDIDKILQLSRLFGVTTDYLLKDDAAEPEYTEDDTSPLPRVTLAQANDYLAKTQTNAPKLALATALCIISPIPLLALGTLSEFGGTVSLFLLVLGSTVTQIQWDKINCDWSSEKKVYRGVVQETPVEKEKVMVCKVKTEDRQVLLSVYKDSLSQTLQSGDNILFYGKIRSPHNAGNPYEFDYASYLLRKQISGTAYVYAGYWRVMDKPRVLSQFS